MANVATDIREDISHTMLSMSYELRKHLRRKRIVIALLLAIVIPVLFYAIPKFQGSDFPDTSISFMSSILGFAEMLIIICAAMFAGDAVSGEFENKTALLSLSSPQRRTSIFMGKYLAATLAVFMMITLYYAVVAVEVAGIYGAGEIPAETAKSYLLALLFVCAVVSVTFLFSSIIRGVMASTLLSFFGLMMILPIISALLTVAEVKPWFIVTFYSSLLTDVFPVASGFGGGDGDGHGPGGGMFDATPNFTTGVEVMAAYAIILLAIALYLATRRDVE